MKHKNFLSSLFVGLLVIVGATGCNSQQDDGFYNVTYANYDNTVLYVDKVAEGEYSEYQGETPTRPDDEVYTYTFSGWSPDIELVPILEDTFVKASYDVKVKEGVNYDQTTEAWSEQGHVYFHYLRTRFEASEPDYGNWAMWIWQKYPSAAEGSLWGASSSSLDANFPYKMSNNWMTKIGDKESEDGNYITDPSGVIMDVDLNKNIVDGRLGKPAPLKDSKELGFLVVDQRSMDGGTHWTSDGGVETYIENFDKELAKKGYLHIYLIQGNVGDYRLSFSTDIPDNPVIDNPNVDYSSKEDIEDSSSEKYGPSSTAQAFRNLGVGYQIFVPSFRDSNGDGIGDIKGIIDALPYLKDLGVEVLWLTPIQKSGSYHGYDITDFYQIDPKFGTEEDYRSLIYQAHHSGMKVLLDFVVNHTSKNNIWFKKSQKAVVEDGINYRDMYHWKKQGALVPCYLPKDPESDADGYKLIPVEQHTDWYKDGETQYYYYGKFGGGMAELNYECQATRDHVIDMALFWLNKGVDGFRLDAVKHIYMRDEVKLSAAQKAGDTIIVDRGLKKPYFDEEKGEIVKDVPFDYSSDLTKNVQFWKEFAHKLKAQYPNCFLVGENFDGWGKRIAPYYQGLDSQFDFPLFYHNYENLYMKNDAKGLTGSHYDETYARYASFDNNQLDGSNITLQGGKRPDFINSPFTSNHDTPRMINYINSTKGKNDQGQDAGIASEKITGTKQEISRAKVALASTILNPGISWIYYGDELGMTGNTDTHIETYGNLNNLDICYRQPFKWSNSEVVAHPTFGKYTIAWDSYNKDVLKSADEQAANPNDGDMYDLAKQLVRIKKQYIVGAKSLKNEDHSGEECNALVKFKFQNKDGQIIRVYINSGALGNKTFNVNGTILDVLNGASKSGNGATIPPYGIVVAR